MSSFWKTLVSLKALSVQLWSAPGLGGLLSSSTFTPSNTQRARASSVLISIMNAFFLLLLVGLCSAVVLQHKMVHVESAMKRMLREGTWRRVVEARHSFRAVTSQQVNDQYDVQYLGNITISTPQQTYLALLDTGSADLFVYDDMGGGLERDLGGVDETQLVVPDTSFYRLKPSPFSGSGFGVVGLAFPAVTTNNTIPILINAINQGLLDQPLFTVYLIHNPVVSGYGGIFTYGGIDTNNCGEIIAYQPLSSATFYQFRMTAVLLGDYIATKNWDVISDTGTSFIMAPQVQSDAIANVAGGQWDDWNEIYWIDCGKTFPDLVLTIGSRQYSIQSANLIVPAGNDENCLLALAPYDPAGFGASWILGDPVIRQYCHIYDIGNQRIGFATPKSAL